jgi:hypothetical protein
MELRIVIDDRIVGFFRSVKRALSRRRVAWIFAGSVLASGVVAIGAPVQLRHTFSPGDTIKAAEINDNFADLAQAVNALVIDDDRIIEVSPAQNCDGIRNALKDLAKARIVSTATVTIKIDAGKYTCTDSLEVKHPNGNRIKIIGAGTTPAEVELDFPVNKDGLVVPDGSTLLELDNLALVGGDTGAGTTPTGAGIAVRRGGTLAGFKDVVVSKFNDGMIVSYGGNVVGLNLTVTDNARIGVYTTYGGHVTLTDSIAQNNAGDGFRASDGASMSLFGCKALGNKGAGFHASEGGTLIGDTLTATKNLDGFLCETHSTLVVHDPTVTDNNRNGFYAVRGGYIHYEGTSNISGNLGANTVPPLNTPDPGTTAVVNN